MSDLSGSPTFSIKALSDLQKRPPLFSPGEAQFWTDPHIASQMLAFHLDPNIEAASRRPETIQRTVDWLIQTLELKPGHHLLDLGCGPGLYAARLAKYGLHVTGVDFSQNSIDYAVKTAWETGFNIEYRCQNYLELDDESQFDAVLLIYGDFCPLSPQQRTRLLANVHRALKPGGYFVLDVTTPLLRQREGLKNGWYAAQSGFWKSGPHLVLEQGFSYDGEIFLDQYIVIEETGKISVYRNWFQDYSSDKIIAELDANGFHVEDLWSNLEGTSFSPNADWIGVVARKA